MNWDDQDAPPEWSTKDNKNWEEEPHPDWINTNTILKALNPSMSPTAAQCAENFKKSKCPHGVRFFHPESHCFSCDLDTTKEDAKYWAAIRQEKKPQKDEPKDPSPPSSPKSQEWSSDDWEEIDFDKEPKPFQERQTCEHGILKIFKANCLECRGEPAYQIYNPHVLSDIEDGVRTMSRERWDFEQQPEPKKREPKKQSCSVDKYLKKTGLDKVLEQAVQTFHRKEASPSKPPAVYRKQGIRRGDSCEHGIIFANRTQDYCLDCDRAGIKNEMIDYRRCKIDHREIHWDDETEPCQHERYSWHDIKAANE